MSKTYAGEIPVSRPSHHFQGTFTVTNNGISIIPSFSLGRPAAFVDLSIGGERFSFDPMFRFGLDGKPWTFVLWGRYKLIRNNRFSVSVGGHPAFLFQEVDMQVQNKSEKLLVSNRYLAGEVNAGYRLSDKLSVGLYLLKGTALKSLGSQNNTFLAWNTAISGIKLYKDVQLKINPQVFYLQVDGKKGVYVNSGFTLLKEKCPVLMQVFLNQKVKSEIAGKDLVWNVSLMYHLNQTYERN